MKKRSDILEFKVRKETATPEQIAKRGKRPYYFLSKLTGRHILIIQRRLEGKKYPEISAEFHIKEKSLGFFFMAPIVKEKIREIVSQQINDAQELLQSASSTALEHLVSRLMATDEVCPPRIKDEIAKDILNRAGIIAPQKHEIKDTTDRKPPFLLLEQEMLKVNPIQRQALVEALNLLDAPKPDNGEAKVEIIEAEVIENGDENGSISS